MQLQLRWLCWAALPAMLGVGGVIAEDIRCDLPKTENGKIAQYYYNFKNYYFPMSEGKKLSLSCTAGYTTATGNQEERIACTKSGWSPAPKCFKKCSKALLDNGFFNNTKEYYKIMEKTEYKCSPGYLTQTGTEREEVQCLPEGWSPQPSCLKKLESCEAPDLPNGLLSSAKKKFNVNEKMQYQCEEGYHTKAGTVAEEVECLSYGWSYVPQCIKLTCSELHSIQNGDFHPKKKSYGDGDVVQFTCEENYSLNGSELIQCYYFGWSPDPPQCEDRRNKCPPPPQIPHSGKMQNTRLYRSGDVLDLECDENYEIKGSTEIRCVNGAWTYPPSCVEVKEKVQCGLPPSIENGEPVPTSEAYYAGDTVEYRCAQGYEMLGAKDIQCKRGKWQPPPKCLENTEQCRPPPSIRNGDIGGPLLTSYPTGSSVEYSCHNYYLMEGPRTVHCNQGVWSAQPVCLEPCTIDSNEMRSNNVELLWNSKANVHSLHGDIIEFTCNQGFILSQYDLKAQCVNGKLTYPQCIKKGTDGSCGSPPAIHNGGIVSPQTSYSTGSSVEYSCLDHHFLQGSRTIYCSNGQWSSPPTCIEPCRLSLVEIEKNNLELRWSFDNREYFFHGDYIEFTCKRGFYSSPSAGTPGIRIQCMFGQLKYPKCT
ncbi:coagulation factor XIII B chain [Ambystoma mexicanum]|uniref:coagulation factor XIII B chain n=1 Tax=Ambystoma mexicanum TaxID=8296 RepID=UPI0037E81260